MYLTRYLGGEPLKHYRAYSLAHKEDFDFDVFIEELKDHFLTIASGE